jgi:hypothetical protein
MTERVAVRIGFDPLPADAGPAQRFARTLAEDMPRIIRLGHDSGDPQVIYHCPSCGSGQVIARSDGTVECGFCKMCFTVQVQPRYPAFPQTINGVPMEVPGMGPTWPGQDDDQTMQAQDAAEGMPVDPDAEEDPDAAEDPQAPDAAPDDTTPEDSGNPFAKKSFRSVNGTQLTEDQLLRHIALETAHDRARMARTLRQKNGAR